MLHLLHGNLGRPGDWDPVLALLSPPRRDTVAWSLWRTRREWAEASTLTAWARRFNAEVSRRGGNGPHRLAGYSLGGRLALHALLDRPSLWQAAVILSAHPGLPDPDGRHARREADAAWHDRCLVLPWPEFLTAWEAQSVLAPSTSSTAATEPASLQPWRHEIATGFLDWSTGCQAHLVPALAALTVPVQWLTGARDAKFTALAAAAAALCPRIAHCTVPGAGHRLLADAPLAVASALSFEGSRSPA